jgi:hypothetical protein
MPTDYSGHFLIEKRREVEKRICGVKDCGSRLPLPFMVIA